MRIAVVRLKPCGGRQNSRLPEVERHCNCLRHCTRLPEAERCHSRLPEARRVTLTQSDKDRDIGLDTVTSDQGAPEGHPILAAYKVIAPRRGCMMAPLQEQLQQCLLPIKEADPPRGPLLSPRWTGRPHTIQPSSLALVLGDQQHMSGCPL